MAIKGHPSFLGATNRFPQGKLDKTDEGELRFAVSRQGDLVHVDFGTEVIWLALPPNIAVEFAKALLDQAGVTYQIDE